MGTKEIMRLHPAAGGNPVGMTAMKFITTSGRLDNIQVIEGRNDGSRKIRKNWCSLNATFGRGVRGCSRNKLSLMEMSKLLPTTYHYDVAIRDPEQPWKSRFQAETEFLCKLSKRKQDNVSNIIRQNGSVDHQ